MIMASMTDNEKAVEIMTNQNNSKTMLGMK